MTTIYSAITNLWAFQVSDRLLTRNNSSNIEQFDTVSNKTVIYVAKDGIVSISYTGTAYIGKIPTDRWIAESLHGQDLQEGNDFRIGSDYPIEQGLNNAIEILVAKLNEVWQIIPREQRNIDIQMSITGWQIAKSRPFIRPVLWWLEGSGTEAKPFKRAAMKRFWPKRQLATISTGVTIPQKELSQIKEAVLKERKSGTEITAESTIVESLRNICSRYETVGSDFLGVRISLHFSPSIYIKYFPDPNKVQPERPHKAPYNNRSGLVISIGNPDEAPSSPPDIESREVYFSPWIISANMVMPPSSVIGTCIISLGSNLEAKIIGPDGNNELISGFISQSRPKLP